MKILKSLLLLTMILTSCTSKPVTFTQEELWLNSGGKKVYGVLYRPDGVKKAPLVIVSHGFGATYQTGIPYAEKLAPLGYAVYCYDFCGGSVFSRSEGKTTEMSIFTEKEDLEAVLEQLCAKDFIDPEHVILIGESQGGMVSALAAAELKERIERLVLVFPAFCIPDDWSRMYPTLEDMPEEVDFWGIKLSRTYLKGLHELNVMETVSQYTGPVAIFHGDQDQVVNVQYSVDAQAAYTNATLTVLPGEGHGFSPAGQAQTLEAIGKLLKK